MDRFSGRELHEHIDTLYLNYRSDNPLENHRITASLDHGKEWDYKGFANGRYWYESDYCRVGLLDDWHAAMRGDQYDLTIQYAHDHLFDYPPDSLVNYIKLPFSQDRHRYIIKRLDYNITFKSNFDFLDSGYISSYFRGRWTRPYSTTIYLGDRSKSKKLFRIYDKNKELNDNKSAKKFDQLMQYFGGNIDGLVTAEVEILRDYIRDSLEVHDKGSLLDWGVIVQTGHALLSSIKVFPLTDINKRQYKNRHYDRIHDLQFLVDTVRLSPRLRQQEVYEPKLENLGIRILKLKEDFSKRLGREIGNEELMRILSNLSE